MKRTSTTSTDNGETSQRVVDRCHRREALAFRPVELPGTTVASRSRMSLDDLGYVYIEYLVVLGTVGILSAIGMMALLPTIYDSCFDSVGILLSIKP